MQQNSLTAQNKHSSASENQKFDKLCKSSNTLWSFIEPMLHNTDQNLGNGVSVSS